MKNPTNTAQSFRDKWHNNEDLVFTQTTQEDSDIFNWIVTRNGWKDADGIRAYLGSRTRILDAGCGNGRVTSLLRKYSDPASAEIVGLDLTAADVAARNLANEENVHFVQHDLLDDLTSLGNFDFIYCQEVLHHTENPQQSFQNLVKCLQPGGEIAIYVYKLKAPIREFADDYVRDKIQSMSYEEALQHCAEISQFGRALTELKTKVTVPKVELLGIEAGEYDVQRLIYHFFLKCFWNSELGSEANDVINYDWYHPQTATRHTLPEVRSWFGDARLTIVHECVDPYGITIRGLRN